MPWRSNARLPTMHGGPIVCRSRRSDYLYYGAELLYPITMATGCGLLLNKILLRRETATFPVEPASAKFELVINLKTAKALGLEVPPIAARPCRRGDRMIRFLLAHSCPGRVRRHVRSCESRHRIPRRIRWSTDLAQLPDAEPSVQISCTGLPSPWHDVVIGH